MANKIANQDIKTEAKNAGVNLWQIADKLKVYDSQLSKILRKELPEHKKAEIRRIILEIAKAGE